MEEKRRKREDIHTSLRFEIDNSFPTSNVFLKGLEGQPYERWSRCCYLPWRRSNVHHHLLVLRHVCIPSHTAIFR